MSAIESAPKERSRWSGRSPCVAANAEENAALSLVWLAAAVAAGVPLPEPSMSASASASASAGVDGRSIMSGGFGSAGARQPSTHSHSFGGGWMSGLHSSSLTSGCLCCDPDSTMVGFATDVRGCRGGVPAAVPVAVASLGSSSMHCSSCSSVPSGWTSVMRTICCAPRPPLPSVIDPTDRAVSERLAGSLSEQWMDHLLFSAHRGRPTSVFLDPRRIHPPTFPHLALWRPIGRERKRGEDHLVHSTIPPPTIAYFPGLYLCVLCCGSHSG